MMVIIAVMIIIMTLIIDDHDHDFNDHDEYGGLDVDYDGSGLYWGDHDGHHGDDGHDHDHAVQLGS